MENESYMRLKDILKIIPVSRTTWWRGVKSGVFPPSIKLTTRTTVWRNRDIKELLNKKYPHSTKIREV